MKDIISTTEDIPGVYAEYKNEITEFLDKKLKTEIKAYLKYSGGTYMLFLKEGVCIRHPGATRGYVVLEDDIIKDIVFYEEVFDIYKKVAKKEIKQFIGCRLVNPEVRDV